MEEAARQRGSEVVRQRGTQEHRHAGTHTAGAVRRREREKERERERELQEAPKGSTEYLCIVIQEASTYIKIGRRAEGAMDYAMAPAKGERAGGSCPDFPSFLGRKRSCRRTSRCRADRSRHHRTPHR